MAWREKKKKKGMKNKGNEKTSGIVASVAGVLLKRKDIPKDEKSASGSALAQAPDKKKKTKKK